MTARIVTLALTHRRATTFAWLAATVLGAWAAATLSGALSQSFDAPGRPAFTTNERILRTYGNGALVSPIVLVADGVDVARGRARGQWRAAVDEVAGAVRGSRAVSVANTGDRGFVARDGDTTFALVFPPIGRDAPDENPAALAAARRTARDVEVGGRPVRVTGVEALTDDDGGGGGAGLLVETLAGGFGALLVLLWVFASPLAVVPLAIAAASILSTFLVLRGLAAVTDVSFVVQFLVGLIGLGVAIDYSLLVVVRWREERARGRPDAEALDTAMRTAGHAVAVSGVTVAIGLLALVVVPVPFIRSIGFGGLLIPLVSVLAALTLLPVVLATVGPRLDRRHRRTPDRRGAWFRWAAWVVRRRWPAAVVGLTLLAVLAGFATQLQPGRPSVDSLSTGGEAARALSDLERAGIGRGALTPIELLDATSAERRKIAQTDGVAAVVAPPGPDWNRSGHRLAVIVPTPDTASDAGGRLLDRLPAAARLGGPEAQDRDLSDAIYGAFGWMVALIAAITFVLLARALRSWVLPIKAIALNVLSIGASFGVVVLVWQHGHGSELIGGVPATGSITNWVPLAIFAFLYGLSMDYEVFILSRIREAYDEHGDTDRAVVDGLGHTGRLVTSAALILFLAFVALAAAPQTQLRILATGLAAGIALDATVVRAFVVPALITLLGRANWREPPRWLRGRSAARG